MSKSNRTVFIFFSFFFEVKSVSFTFAKRKFIERKNDISQQNLHALMERQSVYVFRKYVFLKIKKEAEKFVYILSLTHKKKIIPVKNIAQHSFSTCCCVLVYIIPYKMFILLCVSYFHHWNHNIKELTRRRPL